MSAAQDEPDSGQGKRPAWTPEEERAVLQRLLQCGGAPPAAGVGEFPIRHGAVPYTRRKEPPLSRKVRCALLATAALVLWTGVFFRVRPRDLLLWAAGHGNAAVTWVALARGAYPEQLNDRGETPLELAAGSGGKRAVDLLLARGANPNGGNSLHRAAARGDTEIVAALLDAGADVNGSVEWRDSPLRYAIFFAGQREDGRETTQLLLDRGARQDAFTAAALGDLEALREALESDPQAVMAESFRYTTPLHWAARAGNADAVRELLAAGARVNPGPPEAASPLR